jgi:hypothetical protein
MGERYVSLPYNASLPKQLCACCIYPEYADWPAAYLQMCTGMHISKGEKKHPSVPLVLAATLESPSQYGIVIWCLLLAGLNALAQSA